MPGDPRHRPDPNPHDPLPSGPAPSSLPWADPREGAAQVASGGDSSIETDPGRTSERPFEPSGASEGGITPPGLRSSRSGEAIALPPRLEPGQLILNDRYEVVRPLGKGGMGEVWLVYQRVLDVAHALKLITPAIAFDHQVRERFRQEARVMAKFSHPNAVAVHDAQIGAEAAYILMEYVPGLSLLQELEAHPGPRGLDRVGRLLKQLCSVLHKAHSRQIVHRDLKPSNLMIVTGEPPDSDLKVLDFGIAKVLDRPEEHALTGTDHFLGTPYYASPEQLRGARVDGRSDLYSVGVILYELLAGTRPFGGSASQQMLHHVNTPAPRFRERAPNVSVPEAVEAVVLSCLAKDPADRPASAQQLYTAFLQALPPEFQPSSVSTWGPGSGSGLGGPRAFSSADSWESAAPETAVRTLSGEPPLPLAPGSSSNSVERFHPSVETPLGPLIAPSPGLEAEAETRPDHARPRSSGGPRPLGAGDARSEPIVSGPPGSSAVEPPAPRPEPRRPALRRPVLGVVLLALVGTASYLGLSGNRPWEREMPSWPEGYSPLPSAGRHEDGLPLALVRDADQVEFRYIPGTGDTPFLMGDPDGSGEDSPAFPVLLSGYYIQKYEVTIGEIERVLSPEEIADEAMASYRKARDDIKREFPDGFERYPAAGVPIRFADRFARRVGGRLPTEAQWEFAASSRGLRPRYVWSDQEEHPTRRIAAVDRAALLGRVNVELPDRFGRDRSEQEVYALTGNLREWCRDPYQRYSERSEPVVNPGGEVPEIDSLPAGSLEFVIRGSSFLGFGSEFRVTRPRGLRPSERRLPEEARAAIFREGAVDIGFRVVLELREDRAGGGAEAVSVAEAQPGRAGSPRVDPED
ncbi:bifunctional serine/threonine-protein kinase/formylglycine-generating enzyme family protein [Tautonia sociabilis]|uniref:Protein kinase domain-containing protein n=1 Tax=Tautonia sociabilis TaxID=2080755 RepID=A0A432MFA8_9BACT|nr:bifunctional serine/threonine-protein kinase/formylglycine-generating enzyme family protein [Tautonia sociabilis]RUL84670.1 hypothetical protein TsocGM_19810 [Tautonia sociabilis]